MVSIDPDAPEPAYIQLAAILRGQIRDGVITGVVPSMRTLMETHGLGEYAVTHALRTLADEGLIFSVPRRGYYVANKAN